MAVTAGPVRRIGIIGGECSGKSTLALALADALPACVAAEQLRSFVEREGRTPRAEEQRLLMRAQQASEDDLARACAHGWVVADPAPLMTAIYSVVYFDDESLLDEATDLAAGYDVLVWCDPGIPWVPDEGQRDGPQFREQVHGLLGRIVRERLEPRGIRVVRACGSVAERIDQCRRAWQPGGPTPST